MVEGGIDGFRKKRGRKGRRRRKNRGFVSSIARKANRIVSMALRTIQDI